jgi:hypothetical protein
MKGEGMDDKKLSGYLASLYCIFEEVINARGKELNLVKIQRFLTTERHCGDILFDVLKEVVIEYNNTPKWEATIRPTGKTNDISFDSVTDEVREEVRRFDRNLNCCKRVVAFRPQRAVTEGQLDMEFKVRGLEPADPPIFIETVKFLEASLISSINPLVTHWSKNTLWYSLAANIVKGKYVISGDKRRLFDVWVEGTWFLGVSKYY